MSKKDKPKQTQLEINQRHRSKVDHVGANLRPRGIRDKYRKALNKKGVTMREDLQQHVERTIEKHG